ncbi:MAG: hypothetical protein H7Y88_09205 [Phycisphaerales bacterium]|nr:hypothetical protein [Phycisphaerales bacterium]
MNQSIQRGHVFAQPDSAQPRQPSAAAIGASPVLNLGRANRHQAERAIVEASFVGLERRIGEAFVEWRSGEVKPSPLDRSDR